MTPGPMTSDRRSKTSFSVAELIRVVVPFVVGTAIVVFVIVMLTRSHARRAPIRRADGMQLMRLVQKDAKGHVITGQSNVASGSVWFAPRGRTLPIELHAAGLTPGVHYLIEVGVDDTVYDLASHVADARGGVALDTTLTRFADGVCVGANYHPPRLLTGRHEIKFMVKRDGNPPSGTSPAASLPPGAAGAVLPCSGNGDGNYTYLLSEDDVAEFTGTS